MNSFACRSLLFPETVYCLACNLVGISCYIGLEIDCAKSKNCQIIFWYHLQLSKVSFEPDCANSPLANQIHYHLLNFSSAAFFKVLQCGPKVVKMLSECQIALIQMRRVSSKSQLFAYGTLVVYGGLRVKL